MRQAVPEIVDLLSAARSTDDHVRREAIAELVKSGDESSGELLLGYINGEDKKLKGEVALAFLELDLSSGLAKTLSKGLWFSIAVNQLIFTYRGNPQGFIRGENTPGELKVRRVGSALNSAAGMDLMLAAHEEFKKLNEVRGAPRNLESIWDGIGDWRG